MDILTLITSPELVKTFFNCSVQRTPDGTHLYRAHFTSTRRTGARAVKFVELEIDGDTFARDDARMRQRTGFMYNERAMQWAIPADQRQHWLLFARHVANDALTRLKLAEEDVERALRVIPAR